MEWRLKDLLKEVRDRTIEVEDGERRHHLTDDELCVIALRYEDNERNTK